jgi:hypothetical protein
MGKQHVFLGAAVALVVVLAWPSLRSETASALDLFFWLFALLAMVAVVLWPRAGRDQRAELKLERRGWADRIDFREPGKAVGDASPRRADPSSCSPGVA